MKLSNAIVKAVSGVIKLARKIPGLRSIVARFEAGYTSWGNRRWLMSAYQDARFEVDFSQSMEMCRKHIYFCENNPIAIRIENLKVQFGVGVDGLMVIPNASDPKMDKATVEQWNNDRSERWKQFIKSPDLGSNLTLGECSILWERNLFKTGNVIVLKTFDEMGNPKIQTVDRLRLMTPTQFQLEEGKTICQGIRLKKITIPVVQIDKTGKRSKVNKEIITGKPDLYYIRDEFEMDTFAEVPAANVIHKFKPILTGQMVGVPEGYGAINLLHDWEDLQIMEMGAAKLASSIANVETNPSGELDSISTRKQLLDIQSAVKPGQNITKHSASDYRVTVGSQEIALKTGDKLEQFMIARPTVAQQDFWDLMLSMICIAYNTPKLLVVPYTLQGTVTRADLDVCSTAFRADFEIISAIMRDIYEWWSALDISHNRENYGKKVPSKPHDCVIRPPRPPNVDIGYTAQALALEMEMGVKTYQDVCAEQNKNWRNELREIAETEAYIDALAEEYDITPDRIAFKLFQSQKSQSGGSGEAETKDTAETAQTT